MSEQPKPQPGKESVTDALVERLRERQALGVQRYGRSLETFNGRDMARDAEEELLDLWQYLHGLKMERDALARELAQARLDHQNACALVAKMHAAAVGEVRGPDVGPVEDVAKLKAELDRALERAEDAETNMEHFRTRAVAAEVRLAERDDLARRLGAPFDEALPTTSTQGRDLTYASPPCEQFSRTKGGSDR